MPETGMDLNREKKKDIFSQLSFYYLCIIKFAIILIVDFMHLQMSVKCGCKLLHIKILLAMLI